jgi:hypothetical protein
MLASLLDTEEDAEGQPIEVCLRLLWADAVVQEWMTFAVALKHGWVQAPSWWPRYYIACLSAVQQQVWWSERIQSRRLRQED